MNKAIEGDEGGKGTIYPLALSVASLSTPAKTVTKLSGLFSFFKEAYAPGLALAAAPPQTEFTTTKVVPSYAIALSTATTVCNYTNPKIVKTSRIGYTNNAGYKYLYFSYIQFYAKLQIMYHIKIYDKQSLKQALPYILS